MSIADEVARIFIRHRLPVDDILLGAYVVSEGRVRVSSFIRLDIEARADDGFTEYLLWPGLTDVAPEVLAALPDGRSFDFQRAAELKAFLAAVRPPLEPERLAVLLARYQLEPNWRGRLIRTQEDLPREFNGEQVEAEAPLGLRVTARGDGSMELTFWAGFKGTGPSGWPRGHLCRFRVEVGADGSYDWSVAPFAGDDDAPPARVRPWPAPPAAWRQSHGAHASNEAPEREIDRDEVARVLARYCSPEGDTPKEMHELTEELRVTTRDRSWFVRRLEEAKDFVKSPSYTLYRLRAPKPPPTYPRACGVAVLADGRMFALHRRDELCAFYAAMRGGLAPGELGMLVATFQSSVSTFGERLVVHLEDLDTLFEDDEVRKLGITPPEVIEPGDGSMRLAFYTTFIAEEEEDIFRTNVNRWRVTASASGELDWTVEPVARSLRGYLFKND